MYIYHAVELSINTCLKFTIEHAITSNLTFIPYSFIYP